METYNKFGFSLIELLVAISIMAVLMAVLVPNFMGARERARDAQHIEGLNSLKDALRIYYNDNQAYPTGVPGEMLSAGFSGYYQGVSSIGYTYGYYRTNNGDGFVLKVGLEARLPDAGESQKKCGATALNLCGTGVGTTCPSIFTVCAN